tara:strand:+ start:45 stop:296 length:252 start_codon:yes stop_codon:yes gene_type:complete
MLKIPFVRRIYQAFWSRYRILQELYLLERQVMSMMVQVHARGEQDQIFDEMMTEISSLHQRNQEQAILLEALGTVTTSQIEEE